MGNIADNNMRDILVEHLNPEAGHTLEELCLLVIYPLCEEGARISWPILYIFYIERILGIQIRFQ